MTPREIRNAALREAAEIVQSAPDIFVTSNMWIDLSGGTRLRGAVSREKTRAAILARVEEE